MSRSGGGDTFSRRRSEQRHFALERDFPAKGIVSALTKVLRVRRRRPRIAIRGTVRESVGDGEVGDDVESAKAEIIALPPDSPSAKQRVRELQLRDPSIGPMIRYLENKVLHSEKDHRWIIGEAAHCVLRDGVLYRLW